MRRIESSTWKVTTIILLVSHFAVVVGIPWVFMFAGIHQLAEQIQSSDWLPAPLKFALLTLEDGWVGPAGAFVSGTILTSVWVWMYASRDLGGVTVSKAIRNFNRVFDIEHKPLQCLGLLAGSLIAIVYWLAGDREPGNRRHWTWFESVPQCAVDVDVRHYLSLGAQRRSYRYFFGVCNLSSCPITGGEFERSHETRDCRLVIGVK
jgi:hypothetical protein